MSRTVSLPDEIFRKAEELARAERMPVEELVSAALAEQFAGREYIWKRGAKASREKFLAA